MAEDQQIMKPAPAGPGAHAPPLGDAGIDARGTFPQGEAPSPAPPGAGAPPLSGAEESRTSMGTGAGPARAGTGAPHQGGPLPPSFTGLPRGGPSVRL